MVKPARAKSCTVASWREPLGMPSRRVAIFRPKFTRTQVHWFTLVQRPEEARALARVAHVAIAQRARAHEQRVVVAIHEQADHLEPVARGLALGPQRVARPAEEGDIAGVTRLRQGVG